MSDATAEAAAQAVAAPEAVESAAAADKGADVAPAGAPSVAEKAVAEVANDETATAAAATDKTGAADGKRTRKFDPSLLPESDDKEAIRTQVHFYFSDSNLPTDKFLWELTGGPENRPVELKKICQFGRMRRFKSYDAVVAALRESKFLTLQPAAEGAPGTEKVLRKNAYNPDRPRSKIDAATVYVKGFGEEEPSTQFDLEAFFGQFGTVNCVRLRRTGDNVFKGSVFVEFADADQAAAFVKRGGGTLYVEKDADKAEAEAGDKAEAEKSEGDKEAEAEAGDKAEAETSETDKEAKAETSEGDKEATAAVSEPLLWKGQPLKIMSKQAYVAEKSQLIREGKIEPNTNTAKRFFEGRVLGQRRGRGGAYRGRGGSGSGDGAVDKNDWKKRRDEDRKNGFRGRGGGGGGRGRGGSRGRGGGNWNRNDRNGERNGERNGGQGQSQSQSQSNGAADSGGKPVIQATNDKGEVVAAGKRSRDDGDGASSGAPAAKKVDTKADAA